jgi:hypothetical protein
MFTEILYSYITNPRKTIFLNKNKKPISACFLIIFLVTLANIINLPYSKFIWFIGIGFFLINCIILFIKSVIIDFIAQLFKLKSQSFKLFIWLGISNMPLILAPIFNVILKPFFPTTLITFGLFICTCILAIITIKVLYNTSYKTSLLIYIIPFSVIALIVIGLFFGVISLAVANLQYL